jgi:hypothetical protein
MGHVETETRRGWGVGGSLEGDRRNLNSPSRGGTARWSAKRKISVVLELLRGTDLESLSADSGSAPPERGSSRQRYRCGWQGRCVKWSVTSP